MDDHRDTSQISGTPWGWRMLAYGGALGALALACVWVWPPGPVAAVAIVDSCAGFGAALGGFLTVRRRP
jgi:hypothetical protein